ncbi:MAG: hypothetical protein J6V58_05110 [Clostridia bacterium]|nr:hypothetical protein [Clostridia bacterium]
MAKVSINLIKYGTMFCTVLMVIITLRYILNLQSNYSYSYDLLLKNAAVTVFYVFAEVIIGGLIFDIFHRRK